LKYEGKGIIGRLSLLATIVAVVGTAFAATAFGLNLDRQTATDAARQVAKIECRDTSGCKDFFVRGLHRVSKHKAIGKIHVISEKNGTKFDCTRQVVIKLDHFTGEINYALSARRCTDLGPA
jgi:hypothetical protein